MGRGWKTDWDAPVPRQSLTRQLVFKRLKSILAMGHLPKYDDQSSRAWLYGKLLVALLTQKLVHLGSAFSPWGYDLWPPTGTQPLA